MTSKNASGCSTGGGAAVAASPADTATASERLELLVPIAVVISAGCEPCAERMVARALDAGCPRRDVRKTLGIVADLQRRECLTKAVGADTLRRMDAPLARGRRTLAACSDEDAETTGRTP